MMKRTLLSVGLSAMLAMPMVAVGQAASTKPGTSGGMGNGGSGAGSRMEQRGQQEMSQDQVRKAQKALKEAGFYQGDVDGIVGQRTTEAIRDFQKARGLPATGRFDEPTKELLMAQESSPQRRGSPGGSTGGSGAGSTMPGGSTGGSGMGGTGSGGSTSGSGMGGSGAGGAGSSSGGSGSSGQ